MARQVDPSIAGRLVVWEAQAVAAAGHRGDDVLGERAVEGLAEIVDVAAQGVAVRWFAVPEVAFDGAARDDAGVFAQQEL